LSGYTPILVSTTIQQLCGWLEKHVLSGDYKPYNVFFSGSLKDPYLVGNLSGSICIYIYIFL